MKYIVIAILLTTITLSSQTPTQCKALNGIYRARCTEMTTDTTGLCQYHKKEYLKEQGLTNSQLPSNVPKYNLVPYEPPDTNYIPQSNIFVEGTYTNNMPFLGFGFRTYIIGLSTFFSWQSAKSTQDFSSKSFSSMVDLSLYFPFSDEFSIQFLLGKQWINVTNTVYNRKTESQYSSLFFGYGCQVYVSDEIALGLTMRTANDVIQFEWNWLMLSVGFRF